MQNQAVLDDNVFASLDGLGVVGTRFRESLAHELKAKVVLRGGRDLVEVIGEEGTGRHLVADAAHEVARTLLDRSGPKIVLDCGAVSERSFDSLLNTALGEASGGTLVLDRFEGVDALARRSAQRVLAGRQGTAMVMAVSQPGVPRTPSGTTIRVRPLHEREDDIWELTDHFAAAALVDAAATGCEGFSRQAKADLSALVEDTGLASVRRLRDIVRDLVFEAVARGPRPVKLTSEMIRPQLESLCGQTAEARGAREALAVESRFDGLVHRTLLAQMAEVHGVSEDLLARQAEIVRETVGHIDGLPKSYRNIMDKTEDILRASLWLVSQATTQAEFRRHFGEERFMRPTKSVAWAFYNRVFKRDV
jgi:hypothetical protein